MLELCRCPEPDFVADEWGDRICRKCNGVESLTPAGFTVYECPQHDYCDGGCGLIYDASKGERA